jgi:hypothetical protein
MRLKAPALIGSIALAICLTCPVADLFDHWDHALQTGHDSEYPLVIVALCVGAAFELGRLMIRLSPDRSRSMVGPAATSGLRLAGFSSCRVTLAPALASASPPFSLRI